MFMQMSNAWNDLFGISNRYQLMAPWRKVSHIKYVFNNNLFLFINDLCNGDVTNFGLRLFVTF